jgi:hypothetical protein
MTADDLNRTTECQEDARGCPRFPFVKIQQVAEMVGGELPSLKDFEGVRCADISRSGFAFYRRSLPTASEVVVALGEGEEVVHLRASIIHATRVAEQGQVLYRVGCRFTGRVDLQQHEMERKRERDLEIGISIMAGHTGP